ncbi:MAG: excisionase family DNA-binding protein [Nitrospira sp.]|nr:excisionase family DNA-binding protein [Nitrospira sp.]
MPIESLVPNEPLLTIKDLSSAVNLSKWYLYRAAAKGMPHYRAGRALRFRLSEIMEWMKTQG